MHASQTAALVLLLYAGTTDAQINPVPRPTLAGTLAQWTFDENTEGWTPQHECSLKTRDGVLVVQSTGDDPYMHRQVSLPGGRLRLTIKARSRTAETGSIYWTTTQSPRRGEDKTRGFRLANDGQWHDCTVRFLAGGRLTDLRIDPGQTAGEFEIDSITLVSEEPHPLTIEEVGGFCKSVLFRVKNHRSEPLTCSALGQSHTIDGGATIEIRRPIRRRTPLEPVSLELISGELPPVRRTVFLHHADVKTDWIERPLEDCSLKVARDGCLARIEREGQLVAILGPLVQIDGNLPAWEHVDPESLSFRGNGISLAISTKGREIRVSIDSDRTSEGPVVRVLGGLEQGLLAGVEYLGKGERSSSRLDIETEEHLRFAPDPLDLTMPLMAFVTGRTSVAMTWTDTQLQPVYATPNFFDTDADHRMALRGRKIDAVILIDKTQPIEELILWGTNKHGLPPLPKPPRTLEQQEEICLKALSGPLRTEKGWGHCVQKRWQRHPFADMASTVWRLTGKMPQLDPLVPNGAHIRNPSSFFVTGQAERWLQYKQQQVQGILKRQQKDGSFRYDGQFRRGHFENTASGVCARPAVTLLEYAYLTGDKEAEAAGLRTLEYMKRFRTPRGAQVWEVPLHTPDILASAYLVRAYVRGYELTGRKEYLKRARSWALSGVPFVYLWQRYPIMLYSTPPVLGATHWRHNWIGLPVQWCGLVYAYSLVQLAPYDNTLDWKHLARGILISGEQQQYPDREKIGLLPDSFALSTQQRRPADINPCALVSLRLALDGRLDALAVAVEGKHRVVSPFPVTIRDGKAHVKARNGVSYQVLINGRRIVDVKSQGNDLIPLE